MIKPADGQENPIGAGATAAGTEATSPAIAGTGSAGERAAGTAASAAAAATAAGAEANAGREPIRPVPAHRFHSFGDPFSAIDRVLKRRFVRRLLKVLGVAAFILGIAAAGLIVYEAATSTFQARYFSRLARQMYWNAEPGASGKIRFPDKGPTDDRRGYLHIPEFTSALRLHGFQVESQARFSPRMLDFAARGIYPTYPEKTQAGLNLLDKRGQSMFTVNYPLKVYPAFDSIPRQVVQTLLFIENRSLLDSTYPNRNPAVEWSRMAKAGMELAKQKLGKEGNVAGGSTLATQLEKYKHSEEGRTIGPTEKYRQMISAALRAYQNGENTAEARRRILLEYVNTVPLAALPGYGEVNGLSDGLLAWYGASLDSINRLLKHPRSSGAGARGIDTGVDMDAMGKGYRQVLNLFIAHRRPTSYLLQHRDALKSISENYLQILGREGVISPQLRDAALRSSPELMRRAAAFFPAAFVERKHVNAVRTTLLTLLGLPRLYDLDRLDLTVGTTLDGKAQKSVVQILKRLADPAYVDSVGLHAFRLLEKGDPSKIIYSFTLYETVEGRNLLRVQADNYEQPLNINEGVKLDLGSTAKLRTLVNYLEIITELRARLLDKSRRELLELGAGGPDPLTRWAAGYMASVQDAAPAAKVPAAKDSAAVPDSSGLAKMLNAAMERKYSGSPAEKFFTGGGLHSFVNFEANENGVQTLKEGFRHSVNLVFIRLMRDIVYYYIAQAPVSRATLLDSSSAQRQAYLAKFAEQEGQLFLGRFYRKYRGLDPKQITETFFHGFRPAPRRMATAYLYLEPKADTAAFSAFLREQLGDSLFPQKQLNQLYETHFKENLGLADLGYVAGVHPLEMWLVGFLRTHPGANWSQVKDASRFQIQETYQWLFKTRHKQAQDSRIRGIMELEAFLEIHRAWQRLGYPFGSLVPSYATSIGSSADRPNALAELVGIILNDGVRYPSVLIDRMRFAEGTPYETVFSRADTSSKRLLDPEICRRIKASLLDIVEKGTAVRGYKAFPLKEGGYIPLGGKTGTGDQRFETFGKGGQLLESRTVNRTATFVFYLGDRFFGTLTAHVHGEGAKDYGFTSSLPVALLKLMGPSLMPMLQPREHQGRPEDFPIAAAEAGGSALLVPAAMQVPHNPAMTAETLSKLLQGPAVPDTNASGEAPSGVR
ncbi:MAG TPA: transglycosylase domain-containing protein [Fibrobacteria bacterium]|nr:transglycosylase domain-containing protein [Fibrobacteria bacterium]